ncbi:Crp/Fnr family transcriptional regulator [Falsochrobactrum shanghaiense]|uniref:Crp/Fnr family transcriptional regulator n=1 Tax=Falsochrobactrum shanghaiense TaxID=2201899 RepID=A0A316J4G0_9HYPH|nr:Crp/Fnr family transcriptional regulator [Falsochrobactrum shanghaiense]PWL16564.1 Crp/Fnr family transcriptional regulator [Falsochrobactrum shanghaiense]
MYSEPKLHNRLLKSLPSDVLGNIYSLLEPVTLERGQIIVRANRPIDYLYFLCGGIASVIATSTRGRVAEAGMVGREGFSPTSGAVGATTSIHDVIMQVSGYGHRIAISAAIKEINRNSMFASLLARYIHSFASQISYTVWANVNLHIHERLARWLLMSHDRTDGDEIILTHDFIALMLGVRRPSITTGLHLLEGKRLVRSERGRIIIRDRRGLEEFAGEAYGKPENEYSQLFGDRLRLS